MLDKLTCKLFGIPEIYINNRKVLFPFKKAEGLFYYLLIKKQSFRDSLVDLFWGSVDEEIAKKNLRNAVYIINKAFSKDILVSPKRSMIMLNTDIEIITDLDVFLNNNECESIDAYTGEFLEGFMVKDADIFEKWVFTMRNQYRDAYVNMLQKKILKCIKEKKLDEVEVLCKNLISSDEFNEKAYRMLMSVYRKMELYDKAIEVYNNLSKLLHDELSISTEIRTNKLLAEIIKEKAAKQAVSRNVAKEYFYGRQNELLSLVNNFYSFSKGHDGKSIIVLGEAGVGKSTLIKRHIKELDDNNTVVFKTNCYQAEQNYLLKPWNDILYQLSSIIKKEGIEIPKMLQKVVSHIFPSFSLNSKSDEEDIIENVDILKYQVAEIAIIDIFRKVAENRKIVIVIEDIQWIDSMSLSLMQELIFENKNQSIIFIATLRIGYEGKIEKFIDNMRAYNLISIVKLEGFNKKETYELALGMMPELNISHGLGELIYKETEGNALFIVEILNNLKQNIKIEQITPRMQDIIKSRLMSVSSEGMKILNIASVFFDKVTLEGLQSISEKGELELTDILEELQNKYLLKEINNDGMVEFIFTHQKLREFVYNQLTMSKKRILHLRIARYIESHLKNDRSDSDLYSRLIHHFENSGNRYDALKYRIKNLEQYLHIQHEVFPVIEEAYQLDSHYMYLNEEQILKEISNIGNIIDELKHDRDVDYNMLSSMELSFLHMVGRSNIRKGNYEDGVNAIKELIDRSLRMQNYDMALKGYKQIIYYCINTYNLELMNENIEKALEIATRLKLEEEICILLRLKGMYKVMECQFDEGESLLNESIQRSMMLKQKERYTLNIAADYNYLGESKKNRGQFAEAMKYYDTAIQICEQKGLVEGLNIFNTNAGQAAYEYGDYTNAGIYLNKAKSIYEELNLLWKRSVVYGYLCLLNIKQNNYNDAFDYLKQSDNDAALIKSPYEKGLSLRVKAEISREAGRNKVIKKLFGSYLNDSFEKFCDEAIMLFNGINCHYEIEILKKLKTS